MAAHPVPETADHQELVHLAVSGGVATITLDSPHNRNALSAQLRRELAAHLETAASDPAARVIVLEHTSSVFCAGMDLKEARGTDASSQGVQEFPRILTRVMTHPKPVVAKLAGPARAGGIGLVAAADVALAAREATFAFTEVRLGLVPALISVPVLARLAPRPARELMLTGETFDADRAAAVGLLTAAVDAEALDSEVDRYVAALARGGPAALAETKALLGRHDGHRTPEALEQRFAEQLELSARFFAGAEGQEGIAAFAEKRDPHWLQ